MDLVTRCPSCKEKLKATKLNCSNCGLELNGEFPLSKFDYLTEEETDFVESFLRAQGSFKTLQKDRRMSYLAVKKKYSEIMKKLDLVPINSGDKIESAMRISNEQPINNDDSPVVKRIKESLNAKGGRASIPLFRGDLCEIGFDVDGSGLVSPKIPIAKQLVWEVFDAAVEIVIENGGRAKKGMAQSGARLGSDKLLLDSVEGHIAHKVHGVQEGETAFGPGFVIAAILDWAEICKNERGYLSINKDFEATLG